MKIKGVLVEYNRIDSENNVYLPGCFGNQFKKKMLTKEQKIKSSELLKLISEYYEDEIVGGACHVIIDDLNYDDDIVDYCIQYSIEVQDKRGEEIARRLREFTPLEREYILEVESGN